MEKLIVINNIEELKNYIRNNKDKYSVVDEYGRKINLLKKEKK